jgi:hypothetical protein
MENLLEENREKTLERETDLRNQILTKEKEKEIELLKKKELERKVIEMSEFIQKKENEKINETQSLKNQHSSLFFTNFSCVNITFSFLN